MEYTIHRISLDIHSVKSQATLRVKQADTSRKLHITLCEGGLPYHISEDCYANFSALKADGNYIYNSCQISGNAIEYVFTEQTTAAVGAMECEVTLYDSTGRRITSPHFTIIVEERVYNGEEIVSSPEANVLDKLIVRVETAVDNAEKVVDSIYSYADNNFANAFKGAAEGAVVQVNDVSPVEHTVECKVRSRNLWNNSDDYSGYEYTYADKTLTVSGRYVHKFITLEEGKTYTFSCSSIRTGTEGGGVYIAAYNQDKSNSVVVSAASNINITSPTVTITVPSGYPVIRFTLYGFYTATSSGTATYTEIMLEEGSEATEYVPYIEDLSAVKVARYGKNLFSSASRTVTNFGAYNKETKRTVQEGCIYSGLSVNNYYSASYITSYKITNPKNIAFTVANDGGYGLGFSFKVKPKDTYTLSVADRPSDSSRLAFSFYAEDGTPISFVITAVGSADKYITATTPDTARWMVVLLISTKALTEIAFRNVQLEIGSNATEFEAFNTLDTYSVNADGTVDGMTSLSPSMTVFTDTANTVVSCEYNKDSNKVITDLYNYITSETMSPATKVSSVTLLHDKWVGDASPYSQVVTIAGITENSMVDLTPTVEQLSIFYNKDLAFVTENVDGVVTVYAIGQKPTKNYTIPIAITEVNI